jgi:hypothetical protein
MKKFLFNLIVNFSKFYVFRQEKGKKANTLSPDDYFNLMVIDVDDEMNYRMINTQSMVSGEQIIKTEIGKKMKEYIDNNDLGTKANEKVIMRKFNALYTAFITYFEKLKDFQKVALVAYFRKKTNFYKYTLHVLKFIQEEKYPKVGVDVKLGVENLWFFLTPYIREWCKVHYISKEMIRIPSEVEQYIRRRYGKDYKILKHSPFQLCYSLREELDFK